MIAVSLEPGLSLQHKVNRKLLRIISKSIGVLWYGWNLAPVRPSDSLPCGPCVLLCISISGRWGIRCPPSTVQAFQLYSGAHILISHLATIGFTQSQDDHLLGQSWQCDVADIYGCAILVGEWYSMPLCQSPACLCTFHSMCSFALRGWTHDGFDQCVFLMESFQSKGQAVSIPTWVCSLFLPLHFLALLSNLCMVGWGAASPRRAHVFVMRYKMIQDIYKMLSIRCSKMLYYYMMMQDADIRWCDYKMIQNDTRCYMLLRVHPLASLQSCSRNGTSIVICCIPSLDGLLSHCCNRAWSCPFGSPSRLPWSKAVCQPTSQDLISLNCRLVFVALWVSRVAHQTQMVLIPGPTFFWSVYHLPSFLSNIFLGPPTCSTPPRAYQGHQWGRPAFHGWIVSVLAPPWGELQQAHHLFRFEVWQSKWIHPILYI